MNRCASAGKRVVIVGGGLAGLSAAEALAREYGDRFAITLLESKRTLGGRAGSFHDASSGVSVDYCQHVAMGCCTNLLGLVDRCSLRDCWHRYDQLEFLHPESAPSRFAASKLLPPPLHLASTISRLRYLRGDQRRQIRRGMLRLMRSPSDSLRRQRAIDWLAANHQSEDVIRDFWSVVVVSALGENIDVVSMAAARKVFMDGFAAARGASDVLVPKMPLSELFGRRLREAIEELGVEVVTGTAARRISGSAHGATIQTADQKTLETGHVIVAVPWHAVADVIPPDLLPGVDQFSSFPSSPITGLHLWFDRPVTDRAHAVFVGSVSQWMFSQPWRESDPSDSEHYYQVVISASQRERSRSRDELVEVVLAELRHAFDGAKSANLLRSRIVTDPKSVFSIRPEVDEMRPDAALPCPGFTWPVIGLRPAGPRRWRGRSSAVEWPLRAWPSERDWIRSKSTRDCPVVDWPNG